MLVARNTFWTDLFQKYFIEAPQDEQKDDMLFYVRKSTAKSKFQIPQVRVTLHEIPDRKQTNICGVCGPIFIRFIFLAIVWI